MTYTLYGNPRSGSCSVECALAEIGAEIETVDVDLGEEAQRSADYLAVNPAGKLPCLVTPEGERVTESAAILLFLAERHLEAELLPRRGSAERGRALRWLVYLASEIYPLIEIMDYPERFVGKDQDNRRALRRRTRKTLRKRWQLVENAITGPWLLTQFSVVDLHIATMSRWSIKGGWRRAHLPKVEAVAAGVAERPAAGPVWRRHFAPA